MFSENKRPGIIIVLIFLLWGSWVRAEDVIELGLKESIEIALEKNETILKEARHSLESARLGLVSTHKGYKPRSSLDITAGRNGVGTSSSSSAIQNSYSGSLLFDWSMLTFTKGLFSVGSSYNLSPTHNADDFANNLSIFCNLRQPLSSGGRLQQTAGVRNSEDRFKIAEMQYKDVLQNLILEVIYGYYEIVRTELSVEEVKEELERTKKLIRWTETRLKTGQIARVEKMKVEVQQAYAEDSLTQAIDVRREARRSFLRLLGLNKEKEVVLKKTTEISPIGFSKDEGVKTALENRLEIKMAEINLELVRLNISMASSENKPVLNLKGSCDWNGIGESQETERNWSVSGSVNLPFFDSGLTAVKVKEARLSYQRAKEEMKELKEDIVEEVERVYEQIENDLKRIDSLSKNLKIAEDALRINQKKYEMGMASVRDVLEAQRDLSGMKRAIQGAGISYVLDRARLFKAIGKLEDEYI
ncbi:MAG: TolC family protein [bacterium]